MNRNQRNYYRQEQVNPNARQQQRPNIPQQSQPPIGSHNFIPQLTAQQAWGNQNQFTQVNNINQEIPQAPQQYFNRMKNNESQANNTALGYKEFEVLQPKDNWNVQRNAAIKDVKMNQYELTSKVQQQAMELAYVNAYKPQKQQILAMKDAKITRDQMDSNVRNEQLQTYLIDKSVPVPTPDSVAAMARRLKEQKIAPSEMSSTVDKLLRERQYTAPLVRKPPVVVSSNSTTAVTASDPSQSLPTVLNILNPFTIYDVRRYVIRIQLDNNGAVMAFIDRTLSELEYITLLYQHYSEDYQTYVQLLESLCRQQQQQQQPPSPPITQQSVAPVATPLQYIDTTIQAPVAQSFELPPDRLIQVPPQQSYQEQQYQQPYQPPQQYEQYSTAQLKFLRQTNQIAPDHPQYNQSTVIVPVPQPPPSQPQYIAPSTIDTPPPPQPYINIPAPKLGFSTTATPVVTSIHRPRFGFAG